MKAFLFIDDHAVVRASLAKVLSQPFFPVHVEEAANGEEAKERIKARSFDLIVMDVQMPGTQTLDLVSYITNVAPDTRILMLSMASEAIHAQRFLKAGARGFISKEAPFDKVIDAIHTVLSGKIYMSQHLTESIIGSYSHNEPDNRFTKLSKR